jgi:ribosomal protein S18 acetylase RimI-like enzyme
MKWENKDEIINMLEEQWYYLMNPDNVEEFIKCWTDAFKWYELYDYFFWDGDYEEKLSLFIKSILKSNKDTIIYADSENINWIVQWAPPWFTWGSSLQFMLAWAWKWLLKKWFYGALKRWTYVEKVSYNIKKALTSHDDIYLYNLGVKKNQQWKWIAKKLVKPMFDYLKQHWKKCYLETYSPKNVEIYNRIWMELLKTLEIPWTPLTHYAFIYSNQNEKSDKSI